MTISNRVSVWSEKIVIPTYLPDPPDKNPMFLEKRVYQGSSGKVYPLPLTDRISSQKCDYEWQAVYIENDALQVMALPEIGGRIHAIVDKATGADIIYRQTVIKPALVGLSGSWISGGIEFNWPQHHRPATFLPADYEIEEHDDGSVTIWCSDHDPLSRMKGMHGVCLHPGSAVMELKARVFNRTQQTQSFLWWANFATRVHEGYQSFLPPDVYYVADHARRAMSAYPCCSDRYYGVRYAERAANGVPESEWPSDFAPPSARKADAPIDPKIPDYPANNLAWYSNIPVPTSYMGMGSKEDFFGGYDWKSGVGVIHIADHYISPGKKQWTWGNHEFGYAWDRNLTDSDGPYIELMAGVYTDNQPDFSFLAPGETKTWSQYWYPIHAIGDVQKANLNAALHLSRSGNSATVGACATKAIPGARIALTSEGEIIGEWSVDLAPGKPFTINVPLSKLCDDRLTLSVRDSSGAEVISYTEFKKIDAAVPDSATEPPAPDDIVSIEELYLTGLHLQQYRHATRSPLPYWEEALARDPGDLRCNNAIGLWRMNRGEYKTAEAHFRKAIQRLTKRNSNPYDGESHYNLGLCLRYQIAELPVGADSSELFDSAYAALYKSTWNQAWIAPARIALAEMDMSRGAWTRALEHIDCALKYNSDNLHARVMKTITLKRLGRSEDAARLLDDTLSIDPLDNAARWLKAGRPLRDEQAVLDVVFDFSRRGLLGEAASLLRQTLDRQDRRSRISDQNWGARPMLWYALGWIEELMGDSDKSKASFLNAARQSPDYCFPSRLEEIAVLKAAIRNNPDDSFAVYYLGCLLYDRRCYDLAIDLWEKSANLRPGFATVWRNLGIAYFNIRGEKQKALDAYNRAFDTSPQDARVLYERDQLWKRVGESPDKRLHELVSHLDLTTGRDDLSIELCALYNQTGLFETALEILTARQFQPWEGGEGGAISQFTRAHLSLGYKALESGDALIALEHFSAPLAPPHNLSEQRSILANTGNIHYAVGLAYDALGDSDKAISHWRLAAEFVGDFQEMSVQQFSAMTAFSALAWKKLGKADKAEKMLLDLLEYGRALEKTEAKIDYFATSLPTLLLFDDDLQARLTTYALLLQGLAEAGMRHEDEAQRLLALVASRDPNLPIEQLR